MYVTIDVQDHRVAFNPELTIYDFLQYTTTEWSQQYVRIHQNRLRMVDYKSIFTAAGFEIVDYKGKEITDADRAAFATVKVAVEFKNKYTDEELMENGGQFILRKPK